ncbi:MAG: filamentous hemagglutinin N-terminal domain-containing protein [Cyanobacteria bacterium P01_C01_bin.72]
MNHLLQASLCIALISLAYPAQGQITPDGSLSTKVGQQGNVSEITGGEQAGGNLFHSFQDFSVPTGNEAFFNNGLDIDNILSRVTGGNISDIDGLIRANGTANLFLINPAGIVFGDNATLQLGGSFFGSTATGITFTDGTVFSSSDTGQPSLTINAPIGLDLRNTTGNISSRANLQSDRSLTLSANNLELQGQIEAAENLTLEALNNLSLRDTSISPVIAAAGQELALEADSIDISLVNNSASGLFSGRNLILRSDNPISGDANYFSGGSFRLEQLDGSLGDLISLNGAVILSQGDVSLGNYEGASLLIQSGGNIIVNGDLSITGTTSTAENSPPNSPSKTITLANGESVEINNGTQPTVDIRAGTNNADAPLDNSIQSGSKIRIDGRINNPGGNVFLTNQFEPNTELAAGNITVTEINTSNSLGNGGDVIVDSRNDINIPDGIDTSSVLDAQLTTEANLQTFPLINITSGNAGAIALLANKIIVGDITASSLVNLTLNTEVDTIEEANNIFAIPQARVTAGAGGTVNLQAHNEINLGKINSSSAIAINGESLALDNFSIIVALLELTTANGGEIKLDAGTNLTTGDVSSRVAISDRLNSSASTTPDITLSVAQIGLNIPQAEIGSGGAIFLSARSQINTGELDSSVSVTNIADNQALVFADNSLATTAENLARAISQIDLSYENVSLGQGGEINLDSDLATVGNVNSSLNVTSENTVFASANAENDAAAESVAIGDNNLEVTGDLPGNITFDVSEKVSFNLLNAAAIANDGINNLDSVAFSNSEQAIAMANASGTNIISFNQINSGLISFDFIVPDVDSVVEPLQDFTPSLAQPMTFNLCSANVGTAEIAAIETATGKVYVATKAVVENNQVRLIATPKHQDRTRNFNLVKSCP